MSVGVPLQLEDHRTVKGEGERVVSVSVPQNLYRNILAPTVRPGGIPLKATRNQDKRSKFQSRHVFGSEELGHQASQVFIHSALQVLGHQASQLFVHLASRVLSYSAFQPHRFCLLGSSPGTPGSRTTNHVYWEVLQELMGHGRSLLSTRKFSRNSWVTDNQSRLLGGSLGTPGPRTELLGHGRPILSTGRFSKNSWATDNRSCLLGDSPGTPGPRTTVPAYWELTSAKTERLTRTWGHNVQCDIKAERVITGTSPLGQSLKITERSRVKEREWSRSKESKRSSQSKHQKVIKSCPPG
ncbi:hypothetical protein V8G54_026503 [Vigna mungo]|uniref:Uncharacterized protein n=1 Tax=Vigna mungo TaxID=3915 RepID=A0AAQ3N070_VIGMU